MHTRCFGASRAQSAAPSSRTARLILASSARPQGLFVKYIQGETGTRVQIRGQGSGYIETETGREGDDPLHISIA
jgi:hypothetical protein